jgi:hypothetical protein
VPLTAEDAFFIDQRLTTVSSSKAKADSRRKGVSKKDGRSKYERAASIAQYEADTK